jgi:enoyl-CoA hydratase/carnithine racemase
MAYEAEFVKYTVEGHVANIHLNRPERLNSFGSQMGDELGGAWMEAMGDDNVRVVMLSGEGRIFCAGRDIREQAERGGQTMGRQGESRAKILGFYLVPETDKPIVTAVQGGAWGAGFYMACGSDVVIAAEGARFAMSELPTGIIGPVPFVVLNNLPWLAGCEIVLRGHQFDAQRAYEVGLVNHVVPADKLRSTAMDIANEIAALPPVHVQVTKQQLMMVRPRPSTYQMNISFPQAMAGLMKLEDTKEAAMAFAEKRKPVFKGR